MPLSDKAVKNAKPAEKPYKLTDAGGMYLHVQPSGAKYWRLAYRFHGKQKLLAIGVYPDVSLADARKRRDEAKDLVRQGLDPVVDKRQEKLRRRTEHENTFETVAREWFASRKAKWTDGHADKVIKSLEADIFPAIGELPVAKITAPQLLDALRVIERRGALEIASRVMQRSSAVFRYAIATARATYNPATDLRGALETPNVQHHAALKAAELPEFIKKLNEYDGEPQTKLALRLLMLTFVRTGELRGADWEEFDLDGAEWRIPAERMKMRHEHIVPLSTQAVAALRELQSLNGSRGLAFPSAQGRGKCLSENTILYALYRMGYHSRATGHGFRSTASTTLNEMGFSPDWIERQLAHAERNKVRAAYNRAQYLPERRKMMQTWADYLDSVAAGGKVVPGRFSSIAA